MMFYIIFTLFSSADIANMTSVQMIIELEQISRSGLRGYESKNDASVQETARQHGNKYQRAQEFAKAELRAAERIESAYRASGSNWTPAQVQQAVHRISVHINTALRLQSAALKLRGRVFDVFNNIDRPNLYNPARFLRLTRVEGARWLEAKRMDLHASDFTPDNWRLMTSGTLRRPRSSFSSSSEDSVVKRAYSDLHGQRFQAGNNLKLETIRSAVSRHFSSAPMGAVRTAPGGWMQMNNPTTIGQ